MEKNKHAQALGKLSGAKKTKEFLKKISRKYWDSITKKEKDKIRKSQSDRMKQYWIGWREAKERKEADIKNSVKKSFERN